MKNRKKISLFFRFASLVVLIALLDSCRDRAVTPATKTVNQLNTNDPLYQRLLDEGFNKDAILDMGTYYLIEGDMRFEKAAYRPNAKNGRTAQQSSTFHVWSDLQPMISVYIDPSMPGGGGPEDWRTEIAQAVDDWNTLEDCRIQLVLVDRIAPVQIKIISDPSLSYLIAGATNLPSGDGNPGSTVRINVDFQASGNPFASGQKRFVMVHEIGHALGLHHTNSNDGYHIDGTPQNIWYNTNPDPASVMNSNTGGNFWSGFSGFDRLAMRILYPEDIAADQVYDFDIYASGNNDVTNAYSGDPTNIMNHWKNTGIDEGRNASLGFETKFYLQRNGDVANAFGNQNYRAALSHWLTYGILEGRQGSAVFSASYYLSHNGDLAYSYGSNNYEAAYIHWMTTGIAEGRAASPDFNVHVYLDKYGDIAAAYGNDYRAATRHYMLYGRYEGRTATP